MQLDEAISIKNTDLAKELRLPPVKLHCSSTMPLLCFAVYWGLLCPTDSLRALPLSLPNTCTHTHTHTHTPSLASSPTLTLLLLVFFSLFAVLAEDAIQAAIKDFKTKQDTKGEEESEGAQAHA